MTTIVNSPQPNNESNGSMGMVIGLIVLATVGLLFFVYGLPALRQMQFGNPQINIPNEIDVNINQSN